MARWSPSPRGRLKAGGGHLRMKLPPQSSEPDGAEAGGGHLDAVVPLTEGAAERNIRLRRDRLERSAQPGEVTSG